MPPTEPLHVRKPRALAAWGMSMVNPGLGQVLFLQWRKPALASVMAARQHVALECLTCGQCPWGTEP